MRYRPEIDGLRAVAVVPVILFHAGAKPLGGGFVGVDVFFVVSGYLITSIILQEKAAGTFTLAGFYERRARRILPALFLVMACCAPLAWLVMFPSELQGFGQSLVAVPLFVSNVLFWLQSGYFDAAVEQKPLLHTWSLAVEEQFYMAFPLLVLLVWRGRREWLAHVVLALALASFLLCELGWRLKPSATFYLAPTRAWELLIGAACAIRLASRPVECNTPLSLLGLLGIGASITLFDKTTPFPSAYAMVPVLGTALVILFGGPGTLTYRVLSTRTLVGIGLVSYSAYLWHQPLLAFTRLFAFDPKSLPLMLAVSLLSFPLAYLSWRYVEQAFRNRRNGPIRTRLGVLAVGTACSASFVAAGLYLHFSGGGASRFDSETIQLARSVEDIGRYRHCMRSGAAFDATPEQVCRVGAADAPPDFVLLGDSHAGAIADELDRVASEKGRAGWIVGVDACPPIIGGGSHWRGSREACAKFQAKIPEIVERLGTPLVLMHAMWQSFDDDDLIAAQTEPAGEGTGYFERRTLETLEALQRKNVRVVILSSTPRTEFIVPTTLARWRHMRPTLDLRPTLAEFLHENRTANRLFASPELARLARVVDLHPAFCGSKPDSRCELAKNGRAYFYDRHHLTREGARLLAPKLARALE